MNSHWTISLHKVDKLGNHLLRVLMRSVHVVRARHNHREVVRMLITLHNELSGSLRCGIRIRGVQQGILLDIFLRISTDSNNHLVRPLFSINLIRAHMNKTLNSVHAASFKKHVSSNNIVVRKSQTVSERVI